MERLKVGWVGAGFVGQAAHLERFIKFPETKIVALAELREGLRANVSSSYNIPNTYKDHKQLLKHNDCDAIIAVVNRRNTFQVAKDILESGRHLLTEKPMAPTKPEAQELVAIAESKGVVYAVGFMRRYDDGVRRARKVIHDFMQSGELGKVISLRIFVEAGNDYCGISQRIMTDEPRLFPPAENIAPSWLSKKWHVEYEKFVNICSHDINLIRFLIPEKISVSAVDFRPKGFSYALLDFGRFPGTLEWGYRPTDVDSWREGVEVRFEQGQVSVYLPPAFIQNVSAKVVIRRDSSSNTKGASKTTIYGDYSWAFENSDHAFVDSVIQGLEPDHSGAACLLDFDLIDEIWQRIADKK